MQHKRYVAQSIAGTGLLVSLLTAGDLYGQAPSVPQFRSGVDVIQLDFRVADARGQFVRDITRNEVRVFENGREQTIVTFSLVELKPPLDADVRESLLDVSSNASFRDSRAYVLVLDDLNLKAFRAETVRELCRQFIERHTNANDRVAIATTSGVSSGVQEFTNSRKNLLTVVNRFQARELPFPGGSADNLTDANLPSLSPTMPPSSLRNSKSVATLRSLESAVTWLQAVPERRKAVLFISEGIPEDPALPTNSDVLDGVNDVVAASNRANVSIYSIDPHGLPGAPSSTVKPVTSLVDEPDDSSPLRVIARNNLSRLALETGGTAVLRSNAFDEAFRRVVDDSSMYYMLGYISTGSKDDHKERQLDVRVDRPGVLVQARRTYRRGTGAVAAAHARVPKDIPRRLADALESPLPLTSIELAVVAVPFRGNSGKASVAILMEARASEDLDIIIAVATSDGKARSFKRGTIKRPASTRQETPSVMRSTVKLDLSPGHYHLRVAALQNTDGVTGSVLHDFDVPDFDKLALSMGGLAIAAVPGDGPTTRRQFVPSETLDVTAEVYWKNGTVEPVAMRVVVVNDRNEPVFEQKGNVDPRRRPTPGVNLDVTIPLTQFTRGGIC